MNTPTPRDWLTPAEAAERLGVTTRTLARWRKSHRGPAWHDAGTPYQPAPRYPLAAIRAYEDTHRKDRP